MFPINTLQKESKDFILNLVNTGRSRSKIVTLCLAKAIADSLPVSEAIDGDIKVYFRSMFEIPTMQLISQINEICIVDTEAVLEYVRSFYIWRYNSVYGQNVVLAILPETAVLAFFGIDSVIDPDGIKAIAECPADTNKYYNGFAQLYRQLTATSKEA